MSDKQKDQNKRGLQDKIVITTGAGKGIGKCTALEFIKQNSKIFAIDIDAFALEQLKIEADKINPNHCNIIECDISDENSVKSMIQKVLSQEKRIDILINNAAHIDIPMGNIFDDTMEKFDRSIAVNLRGTFMCSKFSYPFMPPGSSIINIASTRALMSEPMTEAYSASKGGIVALTHSMSMSLGEKGIRVNAISPGWIDVSSWRPNGKQELISENDKKQHPVGRVGTPFDISNMIMFLVSEEAGFITGQNFVVDGGMTKKMIYVEN